jgi:hypothetical protein
MISPMVQYSLFYSRLQALCHGCRLQRLALLLSLGSPLLLGGCTQLLNNLQKRPGAILQFRVQPSNNPGVYTISGRTDFPKQSEIRIAAVRYLRPTQSTSFARTPKPTYSVLAYQTATVTEGKWQTDLNLWQVAKDGRFQEEWQLNQKELKLLVKPAPDVVFLATLAPRDKTDQVQQLEQQLKKAGKVLGSELVSSTADGQRYVRVSYRMDVDLPTGGTTPPPIKPSDINGGWGNRFLIPPEPPIPYTLEFPKNRRTDAPAAAEEFLR